MGRSAAKTSAPRIQGLLRQRLIDDLDASSGAVWILGPAGAGKSTLAAAYVGQSERRSLWYRSDMTDADPWTIFHYLRRTARMRSLPRPTSGGTLGVFAGRFFEALFQQVDMLVIDDCQIALEADPDGFAELLRAAVLALPSEARLLMLSRREPPPPVSGLVPRGLVSVLGWSELSFTLSETEELLEQHGNDAVKADQLHDWTGGWPAGLAMWVGGAMPSLPSQLPLEPGQPLFDFLSTEVFGSLDASMQSVLKQTCLLPTITSMAARTVTGDEDAPRHLRRATRLGLCVNEIGSESLTHRLHPLWAAFLRTRLSAEEEGALGLRSIDALEEDGDLEAAAELAIELGCWKRLAAICRAHAPVIAAAGRRATVARWLGALPNEEVDDDGWLRYWRAVTTGAFPPAVMSDELDVVLALHDERGDDVGVCLAWAEGAQFASTSAISAAGLEHWLDVWTTATVEPRLSEVPVAVVARVAIAMTLLLRMLGDADADGWADRALLEARRAEDTDLEVMAGAIAALHFGVGGNLPGAARALGRLGQLAHGPRFEPHATLALGAGRSLYEYLAGHYQVARDTALEAIDVGRQQGILVWRDSISTYGLFASFVLDDREACERLVEEIHSLPLRGAVLDINRHLAKGMLAEYRGELMEAERAVAAALAGMRSLGADPTGRALAMSGNGHLLVQLSRLEEARELATELEELAARSNMVTIHHWAGLLRAHLAGETGDAEGELRGLRQGMHAATRMGAPQLIFPSTRVLSRLFARALELDVEVAHVGRAIRSLALPPPAGAPYAWPRSVEVRTLGGFDVLRDREPAKISGGPARLLQALIAAGSREVRHERIADDLWPDADGDAARRSLDTTLHRLRRSLGRDAVALDKGLIGIAAQCCAVDAYAFERAASQLAAKPSPHGVGPLVTLYRGPFLPHIDEPWAAAYRSKLALALSRALSAVAERDAGGVDEHVWAVALDKLGPGEAAERLRASLGG